MTDKEPTLQLVKAYTHKELYQRLENALRTIAWCDGHEGDYWSAIDELASISQEYDYPTIKEAFAEADNPIVLSDLHFLAEARCNGCEQDLRKYYEEAVQEDKGQDVFDILVSMAYLDSDFAYEQIESIARGKHIITVGSFSYAFEELPKVGSVRAKELFMRYQHDEADD